MAAPQALYDEVVEDLPRMPSHPCGVISAAAWRACLV